MESLPQTVVIFGASGDLTQRKLIPALFRLSQKGRLPEGVKVLGVARSALSDEEFRQKVAPAVREAAGASFSAADWERFAAALSYLATDVTQPGGADKLRAWLEQPEG